MKGATNTSRSGRADNRSDDKKDLEEMPYETYREAVGKVMADAAAKAVLIATELTQDDQSRLAMIRDLTTVLTKAGVEGITKFRRIGLPE